MNPHVLEPTTLSFKLILCSASPRFPVPMEEGGFTCRGVEVFGPLLDLSLEEGHSGPPRGCPVVTCQMGPVTQAQPHFEEMQADVFSGSNFPAAFFWLMSEVFFPSLTENK